MLNTPSQSSRNVLQPHREAMLEAARAAGGIVAQYFAAIREGRIAELGLRAKSPHPADIVTHADCQAQDIIEKTLLAAFPDYGFFAEENGRNIDNPPRREGERRFVVDPIDGTYNFSRGIPDFSISIALQEVKGGVWKNIAGLLSMVGHHETFFAEGGRVSHLRREDEHTLMLPHVPPAPANLHGLRVEDAIYCLSNDAFQSAVLRYRDALVELGAHNVKSYSTAQRLGEIAAGRIPALIVGGDFYEWDVAAGLSIAEQAGATILRRMDLGLAVIIVGATPALARAVEESWQKSLGAGA